MMNATEEKKDDDKFTANIELHVASLRCVLKQFTMLYVYLEVAM